MMIIQRWEVTGLWGRYSWKISRSKQPEGNAGAWRESLWVEKWRAQRHEAQCVACAPLRNTSCSPYSSIATRVNFWVTCYSGPIFSFRIKPTSGNASPDLRERSIWPLWRMKKRQQGWKWMIVYGVQEISVWSRRKNWHSSNTGNLRCHCFRAHPAAWQEIQKLPEKQITYFRSMDSLSTLKNRKVMSTHHIWNQMLEA